MVIEKLINCLSEYLEEDVSVLTQDTMLFFEYDLEDEDIEELLDILNEEFDIEIDKEEFCELSTIEEFAEYIESFF